MAVSPANDSEPLPSLGVLTKWAMGAIRGWVEEDVAVGLYAMPLAGGR